MSKHCKRCGGFGIASFRDGPDKCPYCDSKPDWYGYMFGANPNNLPPPWEWELTPKSQKGERREVKKMELSELEQRYLSTMQRGCGYDAKPSEWRSAGNRRAIENIVALGLARRTAGAAWNKAGMYVVTDAGKAFPLTPPPKAKRTKVTVEEGKQLVYGQPVHWRDDQTDSGTVSMIRAKGVTIVWRNGITRNYLFRTLRDVKTYPPRTVKE